MASGGRAFGIRPFILPSPVAIYEAFLQYRGPIMDHALYTLSSTLIGFALGIVIGGLIGVIIGSFRLAYVGFIRS